MVKNIGKITKPLRHERDLFNRTFSYRNINDYATEIGAQKGAGEA